MDYSNDDYAEDTASFWNSGIVGTAILLVGWTLLMAIGVLAQMGMLH